jgi:hypothetical protein
MEKGKSRGGLKPPFQPPIGVPYQIIKSPAYTWIEVDENLGLVQRRIKMRVADEDLEQILKQLQKKNPKIIEPPLKQKRNE